MNNEQKTYNERLIRLKGGQYPKFDEFSSYRLPYGADELNQLFPLLGVNLPLIYDTDDSRSRVNSNPGLYREVLSTMIEDVFMRASNYWSKYQNYRASKGELMEMGFDNTPDFCFKQSVGPFRKGDVVEQKSHVYQLSEESLNSLYDDVVKLYTVEFATGPNKVILIWNRVTENLLDVMKAPEKCRVQYKNLLKILSDIAVKRNISIDDLIENKKQKKNPFKMMDDFGLLERGREKTAEVKLFAEQIPYHSFSEMISDVANCPEAEQFMNVHHLTSQNFPDIAFSKFKEREGTINPDKPFYSNNGAKSKRILDFPEFNGIIEDADEEIVMTAILNSEQDNPWIRVIKRAIRGYLHNPDIVFELRELTKKIAALNSVENFYQNKQVLSTKQIKYKINALITLRKKKTEIYNSESKAGNLPFLSSYGYFKDRDMKEDIECLGVFLRKEKPFIAGHISQGHEEKLLKILENIQDDLKIDQREGCLLTNVYKGTPIEEYSRLILNESTKHINTTIEDPTFNYLNRSYEWISQLITMLPAKTGKFVKPNCFNMQRVNQKSKWIFATPSTGDNETGSIITITCHKEKFEDYDKGLVKSTWIKCDGMWIRVSNSFRMNKKIVHSYQEWVGTYIGLHSFFKAHGIELKDYPLIPSMMWRYNRGLNGCLDRIQLAMKNILNNGTFGAIDMETEFEGIHINDIRIALWMYKTDTGYKQLSEVFKKQLSNGENLSGNDPASGIPIDRIQLLMAIVYLRQIYPKDDGINELSRYMTFILRDLDQQKSYETSKFRDDKVNYSETARHFYEKVFNGGKWEPYRWCPSVLFMASKELARRTMEKVPPDPYEEDSIYDKGKTSKTTVYNEWLSSMKFEDKDKQKEKNMQDFHSRELNETQKLMANQYIETMCMGNNFQMMKDSGFIPKDLTEEEFKTLDVTWGEMAFYMTLKGSSTTILTLKVKEQKGMDKRLFYIQMYDAQARNSLADRLYFQILRNCDFDFITSKGDQKYIELEQDMSKVVQTMREMFMITMDQTKYGDMYAVDALICQTVALNEAGYFTDLQCMYIVDCFMALKKRIIMIPNKVYKEYKKWEERGFPHGITENEVFKFEKFRKLKLFVDTEAIPQFYIDREIEWGKDIKTIQGLLQNMFYNKEPGFTLGVYNFAGSWGTAIALFLVSAVFEKHFPSVIVRGEGHSDDSIMLADLVPPEEDLTNINLTELFEAIQNGEKFTRSNGVFRSDKSILTNAQVAKYFVVLCLTTSSFVGQRCSTKKCGFGPAAEVLQSYYYKGCAITSWVKFCLTMGTNLPNTGIGPDLQAAVGRSYQLCTSNCPYDLQSTILLWSNWICYRGYGVDLWDLPRAKQNHMLSMPIEADGIYYHNPMLIQKMGYLANEVRLWIESSFNLETADMLLLLQNTNTVFSQKQITGKEAYLDVNEQVGAPTTRKMVIMNLAEGSKTIKSFFEVFKVMLHKIWKGILSDMHLLEQALSKIQLILVSKCAYLTIHTHTVKWVSDSVANNLVHVANRFETNITNLDNPESKLTKYFAEITESFRLMGMRKPYIQEINFLKRYLTKSFMDSNVKIQQNKKMRNMLGYTNRTMVAPWSEALCAQHPELLSKRHITVGEYQSLIRELSSRQAGAQNNINLRTVFTKLYSTFINYILNFRMKIENIVDINLDQDLHKKWVREKTKLATGVFSYSSNKFLAVVLQHLLTKEKDFSKLPAVKYNIKFRFDPNLETHVKNFIEMMISTGMTEVNIVQNVELLAKAFDTKYFIEVFRVITTGEEIQLNTLTKKRVNCDMKLHSGMTSTDVMLVTDLSDKYFTTATIITMLYYEGKENAIDFTENATIITPRAVIKPDLLKEWLDIYDLTPNKMCFNYVLSIELLKASSIIFERSNRGLFLLRQNNKTGSLKYGCYSRLSRNSAKEHFDLYICEEIKINKTEKSLIIQTTAVNFDDVEFNVLLSRNFCTTQRMMNQSQFKKAIQTGIRTHWFRKKKEIIYSSQRVDGDINIHPIPINSKLNPQWRLGIPSGSKIVFQKISKKMSMNPISDKLMKEEKLGVVSQKQFVSFCTQVPQNCQIIYKVDEMKVNMSVKEDLNLALNNLVIFDDILKFMLSVEYKCGVKFFEYHSVKKRVSLHALAIIKWLETILEIPLNKIDLYISQWSRWELVGSENNLQSILSKVHCRVNTQLSNTIRLAFIAAYLFCEIVSNRKTFFKAPPDEQKINPNWKQFMINEMDEKNWIINSSDKDFFDNLVRVDKSTYQISNDMVLLYTRLSFPKEENVIEFLCGYNPMPLIVYGTLDRRQKEYIKWLEGTYKNLQPLFEHM